MTNVPQPTFGPTGFVSPSNQAILGGVIADLQAAFGGNLNLSVADTASLATPQGQLASSWAAIVGNCYDLFDLYTQQVDPAYSTGRMQDAIARIYFLFRNPAEPTVVEATCTGLPGTVIPQGSLAAATDGNLYSCTSGGTVGTGGNVTLAFACTVPGPTPCPTGTLNSIYQAIPGWDSITNAADGVLGQDVESRSAFEARRAASVALNSRGSLNAVLAAVLAVNGVLDAYATENVTSSPLTIGGFTLGPNSLYVAAVGGLDLDVATAIWSKKAPGCGYNGNTLVAVQDSNSGYTPPYPTYNVSFERPSALSILFAVTLANNGLVPADATAQIQAAIVSAFAGGDGGPRQRIGATVFASRYYAPVAALGSWAEIVSIKVGTAMANLDSVGARIDQAPAVSAGDITVALA